MTNKIIAWFMKDSTKAHLVSAFNTFLTGFVLSILPFLQNIDLENFESSVLVGVLLAGVRAGIKALVTLVATYLSRRFQ